MGLTKTLFEKQKQYLDEFFSSIDWRQTQELADSLSECKGAVVFTGVGKSGHIAEKAAATFSSTGTRAFFLSPQSALHGDIGSLHTEDVCLFFSKSGESVELLQLVPHVKKRGVKTIAVTSSEKSSLANLCDVSIYLPVKKEICPYDLAPTTSTTAQLIFSDCLAIALMEKRRFSLSDFAANHPSGLIGRKASFTVQEVMLKGNDLPLCRPSDSLLNLLHELSSKQCGCLLVAEENILKGIFTDGDLRRLIQKSGPEALHKTMEELMNPHPKTTRPSESLNKALQIMERDYPVMTLPVLENGILQGLIRVHDILKKEIS